ncbi:Permease [Gammaproteobacteria bacterium]
MPENNSSAVGVFRNHQDAENAVKELQRSGYDMRKLSVVGKDYHTEENIIGYYNIGDRMAVWGKYGLFWGWIWGLLFGSAFFIIPGIGPIMAGGPLVSWMLGAFETAVVTGGLTALGGALSSIGIPRDSVLQYETAIKSSKFLLIVHGTVQEVERAKNVLLQNQAEEAAMHEVVIDQQPAEELIP